MCFLVEQMFLLTLNSVPGAARADFVEGRAPKPLPSAELQSTGEKQCLEILEHWLLRLCCAIPWALPCARLAS